MFYAITVYCKVMIINNVGSIRYVVAELLVPPEMECASLVYHLPNSDTVRIGSDDPFLFTKRPSSSTSNFSGASLILESSTSGKTYSVPNVPLRENISNLVRAVSTGCPHVVKLVDPHFSIVHTCQYSLLLRPWSPVKAPRTYTSLPSCPNIL